METFLPLYSSHSDWEPGMNHVSALYLACVCDLWFLVITAAISRPVNTFGRMETWRLQYPAGLASVLKAVRRYLKSESVVDVFREIE